MQIQAFVLVENHREAVELASHVYRLSKNTPHNGGPPFYLSNRIGATVEGFSTPVPAWELGCLADEVPIFDTVLDLRAELVYLTHQVSTAGSSSHLVLPSLFASSLVQLFQKQPNERAFSPHFQQLRAWIDMLDASGMFSGLSFIRCSGGHFTAFHYDAKSAVLFVGDSLCGPSKPWNGLGAAEMISALEWLLCGLTCDAIREVKDMELEQQHLGSQSCGIIAMNGIERLLGIYSGCWTPESAAIERQRWFSELLGHSKLCQDYEVCQAPKYCIESLLIPVFLLQGLPWFDSCDAITKAVDSKDDNIWYRWDCWNLKRLNVSICVCHRLP